MAYEKRYNVGKFGEGKVYMTAKEICDKTQIDSADYGLIALEAEMLIRVCEDKSFPKCYAKKIKICILDSFTNHVAEECSTETIEIASICYNSLSSTKEETAEVRRRYLLAFIKAIPLRSHKDAASSYPEKLYTKFCKKWTKEKFNCYKSFKKLDLEKVRKSLMFDFEVALMQAEKRGFFVECKEGETGD